jgi:hypothetical protein
MKRLVTLALVACSSADSAVDPVWGKEPCAHCMMLVSEREPAAQLVLEDGARRYFDDVGCMVSFVDREHVTPKAQWVHVGGGWVAAEAARYAPARTPMDFGWVGATEGTGFDEVKAAVRRKAAP